MVSKVEVKWFSYGVVFGLLLSLVARGILVFNPQLINPSAAIASSTVAAKVIELLAIVVTLFVYSRQSPGAKWIGGTTGATLSLSAVDLFIEILH